MNSPPVKLLDQVRALIRMKHYSIRTEEAYVSWIKRFILFHEKRHPKDLSHEDIEAFLSYLAVTRKVAASTQNQAFNALLFLYDKVLHLETFDKINAIRAKQPERLPVVLSRDGVFSVIDAIEGVHKLIIKIIYGAGLRGIECLRMRVKDIDFERNEIDVRRGKGQKDRVTMLPIDLRGPLHEQLRYARKRHDRDLSQGYGSVYLPFALAKSMETPKKTGNGNMCFPQARCPWTQDPVSNEDIIFT